MKDIDSKLLEEQYNSIVKESDSTPALGRFFDMTDYQHGEPWKAAMELWRLIKNSITSIKSTDVKGVLNQAGPFMSPAVFNAYKNDLLAEVNKHLEELHRDVFEDQKKLENYR